MKPEGLVEQKYLFAASQRGGIIGWLEHACLPDARYPVAAVSSIYFDTPSRAFYREKLNGDFRRAKVRLRWYGDGGAGEVPGAMVGCYLEVKSKAGPVSRKTRMELRLRRDVLEGDPLSNAAVADLASRIGEIGFSPPGLLVPTLLVRYVRRRFIDPRSLARITVDVAIECTAVNAAFVPGCPPVHLEACVLEAKGAGVVLPAALAPLGSQSSLPLSLGLVGALSIVRFRTPIKEPEEIGFLMLVIAASITCATFQWILLAALLLLALAVLLLQRFLPGLLRWRRSDGVLLLVLDSDAPEPTRRSVVQALERGLTSARLQSISYAEGVTTIHYSFTGMRVEELDDLRTSVERIAPVRKLSVFYNDQAVAQ